MGWQEDRRLSTFLSNGEPRWGYCSHGEANGFCDRGGCDEFWAYRQEEEERRNAPRVYTATEKQIGFMRSLVSRKVLTDQTIIDLLARIEALLAEGRGVNGYKVSEVIDHAKRCEDKPKTAKPATTTPRADEEATPKQKGFIKSLVTKREVPADVMAQVEEALLSKAKASQLIGLLTALPMKQTV